jgi:hypothetical protein
MSAPRLRVVFAAYLLAFVGIVAFSLVAAGPVAPGLATRGQRERGWAAAAHPGQGFPPWPLRLRNASMRARAAGLARSAAP